MDDFAAPVQVVCEVQPEELGFEVTHKEQNRETACWDRIAKQMWDDYHRELQRRGLI